ncbi:hypothetical protein [Aquabacterium sp.]|uniref:hypothetical protein n=1 Tax=Aquabacterium sp. TaxID=1872578 RepID=UPI003B6A9E74
MKKHLLVFTNIALAGVLTACAPQPPKCSDEGTTKLLLQLLVERLAEVTHADKATIERKLSIMLKRPGFRGGSNTGEWSHEEVPEVFP